jgi:hypothetical protein
MPVRSKYFCLTLNNYSEDDYNFFSHLHSTNNKITYIVCGKEGKDKTPHLQMYVELKSRIRFSTAKNIFGDKTHIEARKGSAQEAAEYCKKEGDFFEHGEISNPKPGHRSDLETLQRDLDNGMNLTKVSDEHFSSFLRYRRSINTYIQLHAIKRNWKTKVIVYWGKTGTGKTRKAFEQCLAAPYVHPGGQWFDGYQTQQFAIFDDFGGSEFKLSYLLKLLDRYPMKVPIKGDFVEWAPKVIYITSNLNPTNWFPNAHKEHVEALFRRFDQVKEFN